MSLMDSNLRLRPATLEDAGHLNTWWNDGAVMAHAGFPDGLGQSLEQTRQAIAYWESARGELFIIEFDHVPVGECNYRILNEHTAECGWKICETAAQNRGHGTRLIRLMLNYLFTDPALQAKTPIYRAIWDTNRNNLRAQHVYEHKIGARRLREQRDAWQDQRGVWQSSVDYEVLKSEYLR